MSNTIHRIWLGSEMPAQFKANGQAWLDLNPDWELQDWDLDELQHHEWANQEIVDVMLHEIDQPGADRVAGWTHIADVLAYELVHKFGGLYVNTDITPIKPLSALSLDERTPALAMEDDTHAVNMAMWGRAGDPFFADVIRRLPARYHGNPKAGMHITTGVGLLMEALSEWRGPVALWPREVWNPVHWADIPYGTVPDVASLELPASTVAVHAWTHRLFQRGAEILP